MKTIALGSQGLKVSELGYGCMGLTSFYGPKLEDDEIVTLLKKTHELGCTFWDTANLYVFFDPWRLLRLSSPIACQEEVIGDALEQIGRENIILATKTGLELTVFPKVSIDANGAPAFIRQQCEASLKRLRTEYIDLFYLHRIDQKIPIEVTMMEMKKLVEEGKVKYVGLSECSAATLRRAHKVHPITAIQVEYSLWCRGIEKEIIPTCAELGIGIVPYSPLGRGFFGGSVKQVTDSNDYRASLPRFSEEGAKKNALLLEKVQKIADDKGVTTAQLALAWVHSHLSHVNGAGMVAIPGTTKEKNLISNIKSLDITLSTEELKALEDAVPEDDVFGDRYTDKKSFEYDENPELTPEQAKELGLE